MKLTDFFSVEYKASPKKAVKKLTNDTFLKKNGWSRVFHEGVGEGIFSPDESLVVVFDEDDLDSYAEYSLYRYNPDAWVKANTYDDWEAIYDGENGEDFEVEAVEV